MIRLAWCAGRVVACADGPGPRDDATDLVNPVAIISAGVAAGHDGAARELARRLEVLGCPCTVYDLLTFLPAGIGRLLRDSYRTQLRVAPGGWQWLYTTLGRPGVTRVVGEAAARLAGPRLLAALPPGVRAVVSTYPLAGRTLGRLRRTGRLQAPVITYLTDMSVHPLWVADGVDVHLALHAEPAREAERLGARVVKVVSPAVPPAFAAVTRTAARARSRQRLGLPVTGRLALVVAGSWGVGEIEQTVAEIVATGRALPVVVCGDNEALRARLQRAGRGVTLGWTDAMPGLLAACDVVVQNAGGLTSLEALAAGTPVLSYRCLPGHGLTNSAALDRAGLAPLVRGPVGLSAALAELFRPDAGDPAGQARWALFAAPDPAEVVASLAGLVRRSPMAPLRARDVVVALDAGAGS